MNRKFEIKPLYQLIKERLKDHKRMRLTDKSNQTKLTDMGQNITRNKFESL